MTETPLPAPDRHDARARIVARLRAELLEPQPAAIVALARALAGQYGPTVAAVLFYGSCLRDRTSEGLIDVYVLADTYPVAGMSAIGALAAHLLPPTVHHRAFENGGEAWRAKVALLSRRQLETRLRPDSPDTSLWARFCQPVALVYARKPEIVDEIAGALADAVVAAAQWAARLGPHAGEPRDYWQALFRATYAAELRVERPERIAQIYAAAPGRYDAMLLDGWRAGLGASASPAANPLPAEARRRGARAWHRQRWRGKVLNALRLVKAAFTFDGGADYIAWKVERHSGRRIPLTRFQRRHPLLAAPSILWLLVRHRIVR